MYQTGKKMIPNNQKLASINTAPNLLSCAELEELQKTCKKILVERRVDFDFKGGGSLRCTVDPGSTKTLRDYINERPSWMDSNAAQYDYSQPYTVFIKQKKQKRRIADPDQPPIGGSKYYIVFPKLDGA